MSLFHSPELWRWQFLTPAYEPHGSAPEVPPWCFAGHHNALPLLSWAIDTTMKSRIANSETKGCVARMLKVSGAGAAYLALEPSLSLSSASGGNPFILTPELLNSLVHVQVATVVHLHHDASVGNAVLEFVNFLRNDTTCSYITEHCTSMGMGTKRPFHPSDSQRANNVIQNTSHAITLGTKTSSARMLMDVKQRHNSWTITKLWAKEGLHAGWRDVSHKEPPLSHHRAATFGATLTCWPVYILVSSISIPITCRAMGVGAAEEVHYYYSQEPF